MNKGLIYIELLLFLSACNSQANFVQAVPNRTAPFPTPGATPTLSPDELKIPTFDHIIMILFENHSYAQVIGNKKMPTFNQLAVQNVLLTEYFAVVHPSLPNYIALMGGDTFGITSNCKTCFINQPSLPDLIEASGRPWKTYQEDLPKPCFVGDSGNYVQKHDPFIYFDLIRNNPERCPKNIVSLKELGQDLASRWLLGEGYRT